MIVAEKDNHKIYVMTMAEPVDQCRGVVQCALEGCQAHMPLIDPQVDGGSVSERVEWFLEHHECFAPSVVARQRKG